MEDNDHTLGLYFNVSLGDIKLQNKAAFGMLFCPIIT